MHAYTCNSIIMGVPCDKQDPEKKINKTMCSIGGINWELVHIKIEPNVTGTKFYDLPYLDVHVKLTGVIRESEVLLNC